MYKFVVNSVKALTPSVMLLTLENQSGKDFRFTPGQYAAIQTRPGGKPSAARCFSIVSTPHDDKLQFAFRITGDYSYRLSQLKPGTVVYVQGPFGDFCVDSDADSSLALFAGGIGITPFISMVREFDSAGQTLPTTLVYACRNITDTPFVSLLSKLATRNKSLRVILVTEQPPAEPVANIQIVNGRIDQKLLESLGMPAGTTYFLCGPGGFMDGITKNLLGTGVSEDRIVSEAFGQRNRKTVESRQSLRRWYTATAAIIVLLTGLITVHSVLDAHEAVEAKTTSTTKKAATNTGTNAPATGSPTPNTTPAASTTTNSSAATPAATTQQPTYTYTYQQPTSSMS